ncbi:unnamed protein product, partial [Cuscuta epithymum]
MFVEALGRYGPGYTPPSQYQLRETLLKAEVQRTKETLKKQEEEWKANGCSVMTDAWTDGKKRSIMNLCVNCKLGTTFLSSKDTKDDSHTGQYIFEYVDGCIGEIGEENVVQVVPVSWWDFYGNETPHLKFMAKRILGLTTSSSGCERNWSTFEGIHTKKRNRLDTTR